MNTQEKFDLYIDGLLNEKDTQELEAGFLSDPDLFNEFKQYSRINLMLEKELSSPLINTLDDPIINELSLEERLMIDEDVNEYYSSSHNKDEIAFRELIRNIFQKESKKSKSWFLLPYVRVAAILIVALVLSLLTVSIINSSRNKLSPIALFENYYNPTDDKSLKFNGLYNGISQKVLIEFRKADFDAASSSLDMISMDYDTDYMYHILKGIILLEKGESENAKELFQNTINNAGNENRFVAKWYLALTLLKENDPEKAIPIFVDLSKERNPYRNQSKKILKSLEVTR